MTVSSPNDQELQGREKVADDQVEAASKLKLVIPGQLDPRILRGQRLCCWYGRKEGGIDRPGVREERTAPARGKEEKPTYASIGVCLLSRRPEHWDFPAKSITTRESRRKDENRVERLGHGFRRPGAGKTSDLTVASPERLGLHRSDL